MTKVDDKVDDTNTVKFATLEPLTSTERLSTVSSPYMVFTLIGLTFLKKNSCKYIGLGEQFFQITYFATLNV